MPLLREFIVSALDKQEGGSHYKNLPIQPVEYSYYNGLNYFQGNVVKYVTRYKNKNGRQDLEKAIHYLQLLIEFEYPEESGTSRVYRGIPNPRK